MNKKEFTRTIHSSKVVDSVRLGVGWAVNEKDSKEKYLLIRKNGGEMLWSLTQWKEIVRMVKEMKDAKV